MPSPLTCPSVFLPQPISRSAISNTAQTELYREKDLGVFRFHRENKADGAGRTNQIKHGIRQESLSALGKLSWRKTECDA